MNNMQMGYNEVFWTPTFGVSCLNHLPKELVLQHVINMELAT